MFRRSSSEKNRIQKPLRYRTRPQIPPLGVQPSSSSPTVSQKCLETSERRAILPQIRLEGSVRDEEESDDEEATNERTRLMSGGGQAGLLREPSSDDNDEERLQSVHINVPEFPIAT
jgi:hypothetical protein